MAFESKCRRAKIISLFLMITFSFTIKNTESARDRGARCEKPDYIPNGSYRIRRDRLMRIMCNSGYVLQGPKTIDCIRGKWDGEKPVCAKKGCKKDLEQPENGRIQIESEVKAILYCSDNYNLAGNRHAYCNGSHWDRPIGNCREHKNTVQHECDFETDDICGWTYEPREGLEWKRVMAANVFTTFKTGPRHDHTTLTANGGHYMLMESLTRQNDNVILTSPIYDRNISLKNTSCFQFFYFMYGAGVGDLIVVVKPVSLDLDDLLKNHKDLIKFKKYGNQNNIWNEAHFKIKEMNEDFQILFVAKSGRGQLSDIAVDDAKLLSENECKALDGHPEENIPNEEYDSTTYESIFEMQSCAGRCFESPGSGLIRTFGHLKGLCNCDTDCEDNETCCPDFKTVCFDELFAQSTPILESNDATPKNEDNKNYTTTTKVTTTPTPIRTTPKTSTTVKTTPTTISTTLTTVKTTPTTVRTTTTASKTYSTATTSTTPKPATAKTTKTTTMQRTIPTATSRKTSTTTITTTSSKSTSTAVTSRKTKPTKTTRKTTPTTTERGTTLTTPTRTTTPATTTRKFTTKTTQKTTTPTLKTTAFTKATAKTTHAANVATNSSQGGTSTRRPIPASKSIEYVISDKSKIKSANKNSSSLLLCTFFIIVIIILASAVYKRFGDRAVNWYMIRFKHNTTDGEDSSSITTSLKRPQSKTNGANGSSNISWRNRIRKSVNRKNIMKAPLLNDDDENDDEYIGTNGNIALTNNIYTEL